MYSDDTYQAEYGLLLDQQSDIVMSHGAPGPFAC